MPSRYPYRRTLRHLLIILVCGLLPTALHAGGVVLPPAMLDSELPCAVDDPRPAENDRWIVTGGSTALGDNNIESLWEINEDDCPPRRVTEDSAYARLAYGSWASARKGRWTLGWGSGSMEAYDGNRDAGQLWLDLHGTSEVTGDYTATAAGVKYTLSWYTLGHQLDFRTHGVQGSANLFIRYLHTDDFLERTLTGQAHGEEDFTAMVRTMSAAGSGGTPGAGWVLDTRITARKGRWDGTLSAEGLFGQLRWRNVAIDDDLVVSPRILTDNEGFWHTVGGISGAGWRDNITLSVQPRYRATLVYRGAPTMFGEVQTGQGDTIPGLGIAWPQTRGWMPYLRAFPTRNTLEVGATGRRWRVSIAADDWLTAAPRNAAITLTGGPITF